MYLAGFLAARKLTKIIYILTWFGILTIIWITRSLAWIDSQFYFSGIAMSVEPVQLKMEDFTNIVMNVNVV